MPPLGPILGVGKLWYCMTDVSHTFAPKRVPSTLFSGKSLVYRDSKVSEMTGLDPISPDLGQLLGKNSLFFTEKRPFG